MPILKNICIAYINYMLLPFSFDNSVFIFTSHYDLFLSIRTIKLVLSGKVTYLDHHKKGAGAFQLLSSSGFCFHFKQRSCVQRSDATLFLRKEQFIVCNQLFLFCQSDFFLTGIRIIYKCISQLYKNISLLLSYTPHVHTFVRVQIPFLFGFPPYFGKDKRQSRHSNEIVNSGVLNLCHYGRQRIFDLHKSKGYCHRRPVDRSSRSPKMLHRSKICVELFV